MIICTSYECNILHERFPYIYSFVVYLFCVCLGKVTRLKKGKDGKPGAVYVVYYNEEDEEYIVDHLYEDFEEGSVKIL